MECRLRYNPFEPARGDEKKIPEAIVYGTYREYAREIAKVIDEASRPIQYAYFLVGYFGTGKTMVAKAVLNQLLSMNGYGKKYRLVRDDYDLAMIEGTCTAIYYRIPDSFVQDVGEIDSIKDLLDLITNKIYLKGFEDVLKEKKCFTIILDQLEYTTEKLVTGLAKKLRELFDRNREKSIIIISTWTPGRGLDIKIEGVIEEAKRYVGDVRDIRLTGFDRQEAVQIIQEALENARGECKVSDPLYPFTRNFIEKVLDEISDGTVNPRTLYSILGTALRIIEENDLDLSRVADETFLLSILFQKPFHKWMKEVEKLTEPPSSDELREAFQTFLTTLYNLKENVMFINIDSENIETFKEVLVDDTLKNSEVIKGLLQAASEAIDFIVLLEEETVPQLEIVKITTKPTKTLLEKLKEFIDKIGSIKLGPYIIKLKQVENVRATYRIISTRAAPRTLGSALPLLTLYRIRWRFVRLEPVAPEDVGALFYLKNEIENYSPSDLPPDLVNTVKYLAEKFFDVKIE